MAVGDIYQVTLEGKLHGQTILNVFHYKLVDEAAGDPSENCALAFDDGPATAIKSALSEEYAIVRVVAQKIFPLPPLVPYVSTAKAGNGAIAGNSLPTSVTVNVSKRTAYAGRKYRGRTFLAGVPAGFETDSELNAIGIAGFATTKNAIAATIIQGAWSWKPVLLHRSTNTTDDILKTDLQIPLRNQRRRQVGKGV